MIIIGEVKNVSGIYLITNIANGKIYVGSSISLSSRRSQHKSDLNKNKHKNCHLQNSWNKYGGDNFTFEVIELVPDKDKLIEREQYWMDTLNVCDNNIGYNNSPTAGNNLGCKRSEEDRLLLRNASSNKKAVLQFDKNGNFVKEWVSMAEITRELNFKIGVVRYAIGKVNIDDSYFIFKDEYDDNLLTELLLKTKGQERKVNQYDLNGTYVQTFSSIKLASEFYNVGCSSILDCCKGRQKTCCGFTWRYADENNQENLPPVKKWQLKFKKVNQYDREGNYIKTWDSVTEASKILNVSQPHITSCCKGKRKTTGGFIWSYAD